MITRHTFVKPARIIAALFLMGTGIGAAQAASIVNNGSFEVAGATSSELVGWTVFDGGVGRGNGGGASDESWAAYFNPGGTPNGTLGQVLSVAPNTNYELSFDLGIWGTGEHTMNVVVASVEEFVTLRDQDFSVTGNGSSPIDNWESQLTDFTTGIATNSVLLLFIDESTNIANLDLALDRVSVNPIPLPPAVWLLGSAIFGLLAMGERKRQSLTG